MLLEPGVRLGNYQVLSTLGSGGMGDVYKAKDLTLGREVAIKVLKQELASDVERLRRFELEARAASALNHPNIVTIYEIGAHEGTPYIAMEYVEGVTLREKLAGKPLPTDKLLGYTRQLAEGLAKAHQAGIVHRDLKPENIVVSRDGYLKILDFGVAKLIPATVNSETATRDRVATRDGVIVGTAQYMSPEQATGAEVDFRSDQFALGSILYEMATGKRAFQRATAAETLRAILTEEPESTTLANPQLGVVSRIVGRCLSKDPKDRYDSTSDIAKELHWEERSATSRPRSMYPLAAAALGLVLTVIAGIFNSDIREWMLRGVKPRPRIESIAVLPLANLSGDSEDEYFADGMTDALISNLAQISALRVISRQSVMQFRDSKESLSKIAQLLNVDAVLQGAVVRAGNHVRVTAQLIDSDPERHLWAGSYERDFSDVIGLQNEVAREVAGQVAIELTPEERLSLSDDKLVDAEAHEAFLRGKWYFEQLTPQGLERAIEYFRESVKLASDWAPPYAALSACYTRAGGSVPGMEPSEAYASARDMAERALELDPSLAEAHLSLASILAEDEWNFVDAEREYRVAVRLAKGSSVPHQIHAEYLSYMGRHDEAIAEIEYAVMRDPVSIPALALLGRVLTFAGRNDRAIVEMERALELHQNSPALYFFLRNGYKGKGSYGRAIEVAEKYVQVSGADPGTNTDLAVLYALNDDRDRAREILDRKKQQAQNGPLQSVNLARIFAALGDNDQALDWLEQGFQQRSPFMITINAEPDLNPLRNDPRFQDLLRRMNFPR